MTLPSSKKLEDSAFKASKNKKKYIKMSYDITRDELAHIAKTIKKVMKFNKKFYKNKESRKRKNKQMPQKSSNDEGKSSFKGKKIERYNCRGLGHCANDCPSLKDAKKSMQTIWSDTDS